MGKQKKRKKIEDKGEEREKTRDKKEERTRVKGREEISNHGKSIKGKKNLKNIEPHGKEKEERGQERR